MQLQGMRGAARCECAPPQQGRRSRVRREPVGPICWSAAAAAAVCGCPDVPSSTAVPTAQLPRPRLLDWDFLGAVACL